MHNIMHTTALPKTSIEILAFLSSHIRERFTVRQIANGIKKDYRITHEMTMRLASQGYVTAEKRIPVTYCRLNLKHNSSILAYIEGIRASRFLLRHRDIGVLIADILQRVRTPFFTLILFGSHVKGTASKRSDLDLLIVVPDRKFYSDASSAVGSVERISPLGIHETILSYNEFESLLQQKSANIAWEAVNDRIVPYGAEPLFKSLEAFL
jgi:predicted nucleotidyltransferase